MRKLKNPLSAMAGILLIMLVSVVFLSARCSSNPENASTVYADPGLKTELSKESVSALESLQKANRELTSMILPSVVTLDVVETRKVQNNIDGFPWFFFNRPQDQKDGQGEREYEAEGMGSGVIVRKTGKTYYVLTNQHVTGNAKTISVMLYNGDKVQGKLIGSDQRKDVALVSFDYDKDLRVAVLGDSNTVQVGDLTYAIGAPMGYVSTVTSGIVSAVGRSGGPNRNNINDFIQTDAAINQGNSGGPLVNIYGEVIGINNWIVSSSGGSQGLAFSIPINNLKKAIDDFITSGEIKYGWLGVQLLEINDKFRESLNLKDIEGAFAGQVFLGSPADKGGIKPGDYITEVNSTKVKSVDDILRVIADLKPGESSSFKILRKGKEISATVKIEERDEKNVADSSKLWPGFVPSPLTDEIIKQLELKKGQNGVLVTSLQAKSPAAVMSLQPGDLIVKVNGKDVKDVLSFYDELSNAKGEIWFDFIREGHNLVTPKIKR
ncbi:Do family serine endopeptidase [Treponema denticola]|jgi:peptidase Do|uniref:Protease Do n=2 Tax=Treponema denticola TaxID=158 RepID=M2CA37_TREDN|nr:Do family serine endopeptidase [Treponema denticola]EMB23572.1 protease Do [Treponema denticola OTK]EMB27067.1 protease Do [Treponema denticola SP37]EMB30038.1 protease Do [Treponema denticola MYR-T]EMB31194.1 protease Do [Treponema denticola H1-T]EPF33408.1 peptidase Do [Treponema denticola SP44]